MEVDLENAASMGDDIYLFPDDERGVAQGCALSALLGDVLLRNFYGMMNGRGVSCLRYVDDFILFAPSKAAAHKAFASAQLILDEFGLKAYDPGNAGDKAVAGFTNQSFEFLGCELHPGIIRPGKKSKRRLLDKVDFIFSVSLESMSSPTTIARKRTSQTEALQSVNRLLRGWGNQYQYCNDEQGFSQLEQKVQARVAMYLKEVQDRMKNRRGPEAERDRQRMLGLHVLADSKSNPLVKKVHNEERSKE